MDQDPDRPSGPDRVSGDDRSDAAEAPPSVPDEALPTDLRPADDNPLAQPADDDVPDDILTQGVGHGGLGGSPGDDSVSGNGDVVGDDDTSATSPDEASSGSGSRDWPRPAPASLDPPPARTSLAWAGELGSLRP